MTPDLPPAALDEAGAEQLRRRAFTNSWTNILGTGAGFAVFFAVTPLLVHELGTVQYGLFALAATIMAYGGVFDLGIADAVSRYVAIQREAGRTEAGMRSSAPGLSISLPSEPWFSC